MKVIILLILFPLGLLAQTANNYSFNYQGTLTDTIDNPITGAKNILFEILDPAQTCVLYRQQESLTLPADGSFSVEIGDIVGGGKRYTDDPNNAMDLIFSNGISMDCSGSGTYSGAATDGRVLRITVEGEQISQDVGSVPFASTAMTLQGLVPTDFFPGAGCVAGEFVNFDGTNYNCTALPVRDVQPVSGSPISVTGTTIKSINLNVGRGLEVSTGAVMVRANPAFSFPGDELTPVFGTTANTFAQGNDTRFSEIGNATQIQGLAVASPLSPSDGDVLKWNTVAGQWQAAADNTGGGGGLSTSLDSSKIYVGDGANAATAVTLSGDATLSNAGVLSLAPDSVTAATIAPNSVAASELANNAVDAAAIVDSSVTAPKIAIGAISNLNKLGAMGCSAGQVLKLNAGGTAWECSEGLSDISINTPSDGHVLTYQMGTWVNQAPPSPAVSYPLNDNAGTLELLTGNGLNLNGNDLQVNAGVGLRFNSGALEVDFGILGTQVMRGNDSRLQNATKIHGTNIATSVDSPTPGHVLTWTTNSGGQWEAIAPSGGGGPINDLSDVSISTPQNYNLLMYNSGTTSWMNHSPGSGANRIPISDSMATVKMGGVRIAEKTAINDDNLEWEITEGSGALGEENALVFNLGPDLDPKLQLLTNDSLVTDLEDFRIGIGTNAPAASIDIKNSGDMTALFIEKPNGTPIPMIVTAFPNTGGQPMTLWEVIADSPLTKYSIEYKQGGSPLASINYLSGDGGSMLNILDFRTNRIEDRIAFGQEATDTMIIEQNIVSIGDPPNPGLNDGADKLQVHGDLFVANNINYFGVLTDVSDRRFKKDIQDLNYGLKEILNLRPVSYKMREHESYDFNTEETQIGYIAQEVQEIIPEAVHQFDDQGHFSLDYGTIDIVAVKAIQELHGMCKMQENQLVALQKKNAELEDRIEKLEELVRQLASERSK